MPAPDTVNNTAVRFRPSQVFVALWVLLFLLYYPAAKAGFVTDFTGWLDQVKNHPFGQYINRTNFSARSLYQFTQLLTYIFYMLFGIHAWLWHLLFITLHAVNATLMYCLCKQLLDDTGVAISATTSFGGVLLFCVSPYMSEVIVWEPAFHFLTGLLFILLILLWVQRYIHTGAVKYAWRAGILYALSLFSLEVFYITPWLVLALILFYRFACSADKRNSQRAIFYFFIPLLVLFAGRLLLFRAAYGSWVSRIGTDTVTALRLSDLGKPAKYLFHLLFLGRFFSHGIRQNVYGFCDSATGISAFYGLTAVVLAVVITRFRKMGGKGKVAGLLFVFMLITLALLVPLWFSDLMLVLFDRYSYFTAALFYMLIAVLMSFISMHYLKIGLYVLYALANLRFAIKVSRYWAKAYRVDHGLLTGIHNAGNKTIVLLNLPESMNGVPMIGSEKESEFKLMHNLLFSEQPLNNVIYDVLSYNMTTPEDGAHTTVINDSTVRVTLNQWGTWWWYEGKGAYSYENGDYKLNLVDGGHFYELTLKKPATEYLLLYQVGSQWKTVDWSKKNEDQN
jgi:hypothetical protein